MEPEALNAAETQRPTDGYTDAQARAVAAIIHEATAGNDLLLRMMIGETVVVQPPYGSLEEFNRRNTGAQSLEKVAARLADLDPDTRWTAGKLYDCARFYEQSVVLGPPSQWPKLLYSHYRAVQGLGWDRQRELLDQAQREHMTARALEKLVAGARSSASAAETKAVVSVAARLLRRVAEAVKDREQLAAELSREGVASEEVAGLVEDLARIDARVGELRKRLPA